MDVEAPTELNTDVVWLYKVLLPAAVFSKKDDFVEGGNLLSCSQKHYKTVLYLHYNFILWLPFSPELFMKNRTCSV